MKKILLFTFALIVGMGLANAELIKFGIPKDRTGNIDAGLKSAGVNTCYLVTSTTPALATDSAGTTFTEGFVHWVILGSTDTLPALGLFLEMRSTDTANITTARLTPRLMALENSAGNSVESQVIKFDPPIPFSNGLSLNIGPAAESPNANLEFGVGIRWKSQQ